MFDLDNASHTVIEQSNAATNPYFAISKSKTTLKWCLRGNCVIPRNALYVIARSNATWQSPGRVTLLIIWWFLLNCQKDILAIIYNSCVLININTREYDVKI